MSGSARPCQRANLNGSKGHRKPASSNLPDCQPASLPHGTRERLALRGTVWHQRPRRACPSPSPNRRPPRLPTCQPASLPHGTRERLALRCTVWHSRPTAPTNRRLQKPAASTANLSTCQRATSLWCQGVPDCPNPPDRAESPAHRRAAGNCPCREPPQRKSQSGGKAWHSLASSPPSRPRVATGQPARGHRLRSSREPLVTFIWGFSPDEPPIWDTVPDARPYHEVSWQQTISEARPGEARAGHRRTESLAHRVACAPRLSK
jgi:hypothetical protein